MSLPNINIIRNPITTSLYVDETISYEETEEIELTDEEGNPLTDEDGNVLIEG